MTEPNEGTGPAEVPVKWPLTVELPTLYANQLYVTHAGAEFYFVFGEVNVPIFVAYDAGEAPTSVTVKPLAKIVVTNETMAQFVEAINRNYARYITQQLSSDNGDGKAQP